MPRNQRNLWITRCERWRIIRGRFPVPTPVTFNPGGLCEPAASSAPGSAPGSSTAGPPRLDEAFVGGGVLGERRHHPFGMKENFPNVPWRLFTVRTMCSIIADALNVLIGA
jgi:hypothetical protein